MMMGPIIWDGSLKILMEFLIQPQALQQPAVTVLNGKMFVLLLDQSPAEEPIPIRLVRPVLDGTNLDIPPVEIFDALSRLKFYRLQEQARLEATAGDYQQAAEHLTRLATHLLAQGDAWAGENSTEGSRKPSTRKVILATRRERDKIWDESPVEVRENFKRSGMIICPNCQHQEINGAIYCSKCGAQLFDEQLYTHKIQTVETLREIERNTDRIRTYPISAIAILDFSPYY
jgi:hypothetical protein